MAEIWLEMVVKRQLVSLLTFETPSSLVHTLVFKKTYKSDSEEVCFHTLKCTSVNGIANDIWATATGGT